MKYKEFLKICQEVSKNFSGQGILEMEYIVNHGWHDDRKITDNPRLYVSWSTGGMRGGSCWNDDKPEYYDSSDSPKDLQILDAILEKICPNINFLQYKNLYSTLVKNDTYTENEYYGNCTNYSIKILLVKELFNYLMEKKLISDDKK